MTLRSKTIAIFFAATALLMPVTLLAQITTFVAPPKKAAVESTKATVATRAKPDTMTRMTLSNMKAWVDSAAGVGTSTQIASAADTAAPPAVISQRGNNAAANRNETTTFSNGAIAPNTASSLPLLFAGGLLLMLVGVGTLRLARRGA